MFYPQLTTKELWQEILQMLNHGQNQILTKGSLYKSLVYLIFGYSNYYLLSLFIYASLLGQINSPALSFQMKFSKRMRPAHWGWTNGQFARFFFPYICPYFRRSASKHQLRKSPHLWFLKSQQKKFMSSFLCSFTKHPYFLKCSTAKFTIGLPYYRIVFI